MSSKSDSSHRAALVRKRERALNAHVGSHRLLLTACLFFVGALAGFATILFDLPGRSMNWTAFLLVVVNVALWSWPIWEQIRNRAFDPFSPLVFASLLFGLPTLLVRGLGLALGAESRVLSLSPEADASLNLALFYLAVGWLSVMIGYYAALSRRLALHMPWPRIVSGQRAIHWPAVALVFGLGLVFNLILIREGAFGSNLGEFEGNLVLVSVARAFGPWLNYGFYLLVFGATYYRQNAWWRFLALAGGMVLAALAAISGSRAQLFYVVLTAVSATFYALYPHVRWRRLLPWLLAGGLALVVGVAVATRYREFRVQSYGSAPISVGQTADLVASVVQESSSVPVDDQILYVTDRLVERFSAIEMLGITLARAGALKEAERAAGIDNNIIMDAMLGFIPRVFWANKPTVGDFGLWFSRLYLDSPNRTWNAPTIFGDLYRNFGFWGVPVGMFLVGIFLRVVYDSLIKYPRGNPLASLLYVHLAGIVVWEGTFSALVPSGLRVLVAVFAMIVVMKLAGGITTPDAAPALSAATRRGVTESI